MPWLVRLALATSMMSASGFAHALGLGKLTLHSGLDEALNADIELTSDNPAEYSSLHAGLASRTEFDAAGVDWMPLLSSIKYNVVKQPGGGYVLHLTSDQPMREPFLHFLLQADWTGGHLIREYTALLDPPYLVAAKPSAVEAPAVEASGTPSASTDEVPAPLSDQPLSTRPTATAEKTGEAPPSPSAKQEVSAPEGADQTAAVGMVPAPTDTANVGDAGTPADNSVSGTQDALLGPPQPDEATASAESPNVEPSSNETRTPQVAPAWSNTQSYGPIKRGDTLWKIAEGVRSDKSVSVEQVMIALLKNNRSAFEHTNVNNLKVGQILTMPDRARVEEISPEDASKQFRAQYDVWQAYNLRVAAARRAVKVADNGNKATAKGAIAATPETAAKPTATASGAAGTDLLRIVRDNLADSSSAKNGAGSGKGKTVGVGEQKQLGDKVAVLEEAIASRELENKELRERVAQLEKQLNSTKRLVELENSQLALAQNQAKPVAPVAAPKPPAQAATPAPAPIAKPASAAKPAKPPAVARSVAVSLPAESSPLGFLQSLLDDPMALAMGGGLVVIAGGVLILYYRRRRRSIAEFEESILSGGGLNSETPAEQGAPAAEASLLSEFSQGGMGNIHTDEVDPIAEAEVYLAYGRDEQAEAILKEAVVKDPNRYELRQKLLEIYHHRNDLRAFETMAEELYAALEGKGGKVWERVEEMGRKMNPSNPLFRGGAPRKAAASEGFEMTSPASSPNSEFAAAAQANVGHDTISFDLNASSAPAPASSAPAEVTFDLDLGAAPTATTPSYSVDMPASAEASTPSQETTLEFPEADSFDLNMDTASSEAAEPVPLTLDGGELGTIEFEATTENGDMGITLETPAPSGAGEVEWNLETDASTALAFESDATSGAEENFEGLVSSDEIATKLDLAKAYIDMGDADGARSILNEVAAEGNELQKKQAADLVAQIA